MPINPSSTNDYIGKMWSIEWEYDGQKYGMAVVLSADVLTPLQAQNEINHLISQGAYLPGTKVIGEFVEEEDYDWD